MNIQTESQTFKQEFKSMLDDPNFCQEQFESTLAYYKFALFADEGIDDTDERITLDIQNALWEYAEEKGYPVSTDESGIGGINVDNAVNLLMNHRDCTDYTECGKLTSADKPYESSSYDELLDCEDYEAYGEPLSSEEFRQNIASALTDPNFDRDAFDAMIATQGRCIVKQCALSLDNMPDLVEAVNSINGDSENFDFDAREKVEELTDDIVMCEAKKYLNENIRAVLKDYAVSKDIPYSMDGEGILSVDATNIGDFIEHGSRTDFTKCVPATLDTSDPTQEIIPENTPTEDVSPSEISPSGETPVQDDTDEQQTGIVEVWNAVKTKTVSFFSKASAWFAATSLGQWVSDKISKLKGETEEDRYLDSLIDKYGADKILDRLVENDPQHQIVDREVIDVSETSSDNEVQIDDDF